LRRIYNRRILVKKNPNFWLLKRKKEKKEKKILRLQVMQAKNYALGRRASLG